MKVYEKVREYIVTNGYKQAAIAKKAGIPNATFNAIMNGKRTLYADDLSSICIVLNVSPELFIEIKKPCKNVRDSITEIHCATQSTLKQMEALLTVNIPELLSIEKAYGTIDTYYQRFIDIDHTLKTLIILLATEESTNKLEQMDVALVCEYLRNIGHDIPKPDRHICRILSSEYLAFSDKKEVTPFEAFNIITELSKMTGKSAAEVDYILWSYYADGYGEVCTKKAPECKRCVIKKYCKLKCNK